MWRAHRRIPAGHWPQARCRGSITLAYDDRHRRRMRLTTDEGQDLVLDLPQAVVLADGDGLMLEAGDFDLDGRIPINPSGGVIASNPIGATAMLRPAEAALQIRGDAGGHQIKKEVRHALASGFGGTFWTALMILEKELNGWEVNHD